MAPFQGVEQSNEEAVRWYRQAADQGHAAALFCLGVAFEDGDLAEQSDEGAVQWYQLAANQGKAAAQFCLGVAYEDGEGVKQSDKEAVTMVPSGRRPR